MSREEMIRQILDEMPSWLDSDSEGFWSHIYQLEEDYLKSLSNKDLKDLVEQ